MATPSAAHTVIVDQHGRARLNARLPSPGGSPLDVDARRMSLAREVYRRAQYQRLSWEERCALMGADGKTVASTGARGMQFDKMSSTDVQVASPQEIIDRFIEVISKKQGSSEATALRQAIQRVAEEVESDPASPAARTSKFGVGRTAAKEERGSRSPASPEHPNSEGEAGEPAREPPPLEPLPLPPPGNAATTGRPRLNLRDVASQAHALAPLPSTAPTITLARLGPKVDAIVGHALPASGKAATSTILSAEPAKTQKLGSTKSTGGDRKVAPPARPPVRTPQAAGRDLAHEDRDGDGESTSAMTVGRSGIRIVRAKPSA